MTLLHILNIYYYRLINELLEWWLQQLSRLRGAHGIVLMYHHVTDAPVDAPSTCVCSIKGFTEGLERLMSQGYNFIKITQLEEVVKNDYRKFAVVTFDDVPESANTNAIPYLRENQIPYTLFIGIDFLDKEGYINKTQLVELKDDPLCTIGVHTYSHPHLRQSDNLEHELNESKRQLEFIIGRKVEYLAYPYGTLASVSAKVRHYAKQCGYKLAFSTISAPISKLSFKNRFFLPRMVIKNKISINQT